LQYWRTSAQCSREFIDEKKEGYRALVHELLTKAGLR
jgi:hypothetical protein